MATARRASSLICASNPHPHAGEIVRDAGHHALVVADELNGMCEVWDLSGEALAASGGPSGAAADKLHNAEQRIFYASMLHDE